MFKSCDNHGIVGSFFSSLMRLKKLSIFSTLVYSIRRDFSLKYTIIRSDLEAREKGEEETIPVKTEQDGRR